MTTFERSFLFDALLRIDLLLLFFSIFLKVTLLKVWFRKITLIITTHKNELKNKFNNVFEVKKNAVLELKQEN